ncbi:MAG: RsmD family RNA methyltransferase, partial [Planctomycetaceae bacterium]
AEAAATSAIRNDDFEKFMVRPTLYGLPVPTAELIPTVTKDPLSAHPFDPDDRPSGDDKTPRRRSHRKSDSRGTSSHDTAPTKPAKIRPTKLRIIGGSMRGRGIVYLGDRSTRPMKDSIRETLFNILGKSVKGAIALDLFAGTGALAIESLSRGAVAAVAVEKSGWAAKTIRSSADSIGIGAELSVLTGDTFRVAPARMRELRAAGEAGATEAGPHWIVYFCPPYAMWVDATEKLFELLRTTAQLAPPGTQLVVEADKYFDITSLPMDHWDVRPKGNVTLAFLEI